MKTTNVFLNLLHTGLIALALNFGITGAQVLSAQGNQNTGTQSFESSTASSGKLVITGTSSLHDWKVVTTKIVGELTLPLDQVVDQAAARKSNPEVVAQVSVPVKNLESGKGSMDKKMYKALEADEYEEVRFVLESLELAQEQSELNEGIDYEAIGQLTVAGQTRWVRFPVAIQWDAAQQSVKVSGQVDLLMTDFGIDPPTALLGTLKTGNAVTVSFEWTPKLKS